MPSCTCAGHDGITTSETPHEDRPDESRFDLENNAGMARLAGNDPPGIDFPIHLNQLRSAIMVKRLFVAISLVAGLLLVLSPGFMLLYHIEHYDSSQ